MTTPEDLPADFPHELRGRLARLLGMMPGATVAAVRKEHAGAWIIVLSKDGEPAGNIVLRQSADAGGQAASGPNA